MADSAPLPPNLEPWQLVMARVWARQRRDGDWDVLQSLWRARTHRYSSVELADYQLMTRRALRSSLAVCVFAVPPGIVAFDLWLRDRSMSVGGVLLTPQVAGFVALGSLLIVVGAVYFFSQRNRPMQRHPPRSDDVSLRERWPLIEWSMVNGNQRIPTSRWGNIAFIVPFGIFVLLIAWTLVLGIDETSAFPSWSRWLFLLAILWFIAYSIYLRRLRRRWGDYWPRRWSPLPASGALHSPTDRI